MSRPKRKDTPSLFRRKKEFITYAEKDGADVFEGSSHTKIKKNGQSMIMSRGGKGQNPNPGLLKKYLKDFARLGILLFILFWAITSLTI